MSPELRRTLRTVLAVFGCIAVLGLWWWANQDAGAGDTSTAPRSTASAPAATRGENNGDPDVSGLPTVDAAALPPEARETLVLVRDGGPFPYERDGVTFQNRERILPAKPRGYYREYTVPTPGEDDRGARRIVTGDSGELYYTDDHYASFRVVIREGL